MRQFSDAAEPITVAPGEEFALRLPSTLTTGYRWVMAEPRPDPDVVAVVGDSFEPPSSDRPGAPGVQVFVFRAVGRGTTSIGLRHVRPWEDVSGGDSDALFRVRVQ